MRAWIGALLLMVAVPVVVAGCATRDWVRDVVGKKSAESERRISEVDGRVSEESTRVGKVESTVGELGGETRAARERAEAAVGKAEAAQGRAETAHSRADSAFTKADEVDGRLSRLWSKRTVRTLVDTIEVTFGFDKASLDDGAQTALAALVKELQANPVMTVDLTGYTDPKGRREYNYQLSQRRVEAVRRFLVEKGVELPRINAVGLGPIEDQAMPNPKKRRVTVSVMVPAAD